MMKSSSLVVAVVALSAFSAGASWLWPFGGNKAIRVSKLIAPVSDLITEAETMASTNNYDGAVGVYRQALRALDEIEQGLADRASSREFATIKNKRAYVTAAIDSLMLVQANDNAQAIAVCDDTSALEQRYAEEQRQLKAAREIVRAEHKGVKKAAVVAATSAEEVVEEPALSNQSRALAKPMVLPADRHGQIQYARLALTAGDYAAVETAAKALLADKPNDAVALNLRAAALAAQGDFTGADAALSQSLRSNPRDYHTLYNMARLLLQFRGAAAKDAARRYYETGRILNAPADAELEQCFR